ncbi:MAG: hypothetical protein ACAI44_07100, partial [Candidatus Sericytochromatia bacterium]
VFFVLRNRRKGVIKIEKEVVIVDGIHTGHEIIKLLWFCYRQQIPGSGFCLATGKHQNGIIVPEASKQLK